MKYDDDKFNRIKVLVDAMKDEMDGFLSMIELECCPKDEDALAHKIAHLKGHFGKTCIHEE